ncbi:hypothetical protein ACHAXA_007773 [Cyclostephanos tholiformis]|uniref:Endonuclease/exonuclease/phosphatase domain-containing protein n=1 Tax=Cyclostephanos tholiformis TaxID=382380 RepID=A0ABD3R9H6_9STRA
MRTLLPENDIAIFPHGTSLSSSSSAVSVGGVDGNGTDDGRSSSIASFNLLASAYIRPIDLRTGRVQPYASFDWISEYDTHAILSDDIRLPKLRAMIRDCHCDFVCLQELQLERRTIITGGGGGDVSTASSSSTSRPRRRRSSREAGNRGGRGGDLDDDDDDDDVDSRGFTLPRWISPLVGGGGCDRDDHDDDIDDGPYGIVLPPRSELERMAERNTRVLSVDVPVTNAILYDARRWTPVVACGDAASWARANDGGGMSSSSSSSSSSSFSNTTTCVTMAFRPVNDVDFDDDDDVGGEIIVVSSVHLDACSEEKRARQMKRCIEISLDSWWCISAAAAAAAAAARTSSSCVPSPPRLVIAGDFNSELLDGSCINAFLLAGGKVGGCDATTIGTNSFGIPPPTTMTTTTTSTISTTSSLGGLNPNLTDDEHARSSSVNNRTRECASALRLSSGSIPSEEQMRAWDALYESVEEFVRHNDIPLCRIDTECTRAAYDHDDDLVDPSSASSSSLTTTTTTASDINRGRTMAQWRLDHILYTPLTLMPRGRWATLEDDEYSRTVGLPNERIPTDHMPIAATFEIRSLPHLSDESRRILIESMKEIEGRQLLELKTEEGRIERRRAELERQQVRGDGGVELVGTSRSMGKKKIMKKKGPPSAEMIEHIRSGRAAVKQLKTRQRKERQEFVGKMNISERMVLRHSIGKNRTCSQWVDNGGAQSKK